MGVTYTPWFLCFWRRSFAILCLGVCLLVVVPFIIRVVKLFPLHRIGQYAVSVCYHDDASLLGWWCVERGGGIRLDLDMDMMQISPSILKTLGIH